MPKAYYTQNPIVFDLITLDIFPILKLHQFQLKFIVLLHILFLKDGIEIKYTNLQSPIRYVNRTFIIRRMSNVIKLNFKEDK